MCMKKVYEDIVYLFLCVGLLKYLLQLGGEEMSSSQEADEEEREEKAVSVAVKGDEEGSSETSVLLELQSDILLIVSCLCETDVHRKVKNIYVLIYVRGMFDWMWWIEGTSVHQNQHFPLQK